MSSWERRGKEERKFVYKITNRRTATRSAFVNLGRKVVLGTLQFLAEKAHLFALAIKIPKVLIVEDEVKKDEARTDEIKRMLAAIPGVDFLDRAVNGSGK